MVLLGIVPTLTQIPPMIGLRSIMDHAFAQLGALDCRVMARGTGADYRKIVIKVRHRESRDHTSLCMRTFAQPGWFREEHTYAASLTNGLTICCDDMICPTVTDRRLIPQKIALRQLRISVLLRQYPELVCPSARVGQN
jgi:hypothetical protein